MIDYYTLIETTFYIGVIIGLLTAFLIGLLFIGMLRVQFRKYYYHHTDTDREEIDRQITHIRDSLKKLADKTNISYFKIKYDRWISLIQFIKKYNGP